MAAITGKDLNKILLKIADVLDKTKKENLYNNDKFESHAVYKFKQEKPFTICQKDSKTWLVKGKRVEKLLMMSRFDSDEAILRFATKLRRWGIDDELRNMGAKEGDTIKILDYEFEFKE